MNDQIKTIKNLLITLKQQTEERKKTSESVQPAHPTENTLDYWTREESYIWLHAEPYYYLMKNDLKNLQIPSCFSELASKFYNEWIDEPLDLLNTQNCLIKPPKESQSLLEYLHALYNSVETQKKLSSRWKFSLRSFCQFLRKNYLDEEYGFLDTIFPKKMDYFNNTIIRKIPLQTYPIDILDAASILQQLSNTVLEGRPNSQHSAAEALALCWICLICAYKPTLTELTLLHSIELRNLKKEQPPKEKISLGTSNYYSDIETYYLHLPTLFWEEKNNISKMLFQYLSSLCSMNGGKVFTISLRGLRRTLNAAVLKSKISANPRTLSFLTFLSKPHEFIGHRYIPKNTQ